MYNELLVNKIREALIDIKIVTEKKMFQGLGFMVNNKLCIGVRNNEMMCRISPIQADEELEKNICRPMLHSGKIMKGYIFIDEDGYKTKENFDYYIKLSLDFNKTIKK